MYTVGRLRKGKKPRRLRQQPRGQAQQEGALVDKVSVYRPERTDEDHPPHACWSGLVFLTYVVFDEEVGNEVERIEVIPCRRCSEVAR